MTYLEVQRMRKQAAEPNPTYTLGKGESLALLAQRYGIPLQTLQQLNPMKDYSKMPVGYSVRMPVGWKPPVFAGGPSDYNVNGALMQESLNGKLTQGDVRDGVVYSYGPLQIRKVFPAEQAAYEKQRAGKPMSGSFVLDEVNDRRKTPYTLEDAKDWDKAKDIYKSYLAIHGKRFFDKYKRNPTEEEYWRMWNGGPNGYKKDSTKAYVDAIKAKYANPQKWGLQPGVQYQAPAPKTVPAK